MPKVLITGGLGFIGGATARAFAEADWAVTLVDDLSNNTYEPGELKLGPNSTEWIYDTSEGMRVASAMRSEPDLIIHCASPVGAAGVLKWRGRLANEIVRTSHAVALYAQAWDIPLINISTSEVYGFSGVYHEQDDLRVPHKVSARIEYAVGKLAAETSLRLLPNLRCLNVRPFNVVGADQRSAGGFVFPTFAEQAVEGRPLTVYGDGTQQRAFLAVEDLVNFMRIVAPREEWFDGRVVNVGNRANATTINDLARCFSAAAGRPSDRLYTDGKAVHGDAYEEAEGHVKLPDISLALQTGWTPERDLTTIVYDALEKAAACL